METPSQLLASRILDRLITEKLVGPEARKRLLSKLSEGKIKPEDWRMVFELAGKESKA